MLYLTQHGTLQQDVDKNLNGHTKVLYLNSHTKGGGGEFEGRRRLRKKFFVFFKKFY